MLNTIKYIMLHNIYKKELTFNRRTKYELKNLSFIKNITINK